VLNAHEASDLEALAALWADPETVRHIGRTPSSHQESWFRLLRYRGLWPLLGFGYWAIRDKMTGRFMGDVGFADFHRPIEPSITGLPEAGWVLAPWAHGHGFATEALAAALIWLDSLDVHRRVACLIGNDNFASFNVAQKNGFISVSSVAAGLADSTLLIRDKKQQK